jgi:hypothetical protein
MKEIVLTGRTDQPGEIVEIISPGINKIGANKGPIESRFKKMAK